MDKTGKKSKSALSKAKHNSDFFDYLTPILMVAKIMGFMHVSIPELSVVKKIFVIVAHILFIFFYNAGIIFKVLNRYVKPMMLKQANGMKGLGALLLSICLIKFWIDYLSSIIKRKQISNVLKDVEKIRNTLNQNPKLNKKQLKIYISLSFVLLIISCIFDIYFNIQLKEQFPFSMGYSMETYRIIYMNGTIYVVVQCMKKSYEHINEEVKKLADKADEKSGKFNKKILSLVTHQENISYYNDMLKICFLVRVHRRITRLALEFNELFAFPLLGNVGIAFIMLTLQSYYMSTISTYVGIEKFMQVMIICVYWMVVYIGIMVLIIKTWTDTQSTATETSLLIDSLFNKFNLLNNKQFGYDCREQAQMIALDFIHSKPTFTAYGMFKLDWTLLQMVIGAVATYLVLMMQLD